MAFLLTGCIVAEPPDYEEPERIAPVLDLVNANPPVNEILQATSGEVKPFNVPVRSEDLGEPLVAHLFMNYPGDGEPLPQASDFLSPGSFDEKREIVIRWPVPSATESGECEQLTIVVSHQSNFNDLDQLIDANAAAIATWWVAINDDEQLVTLSSCPSNLGPVGE